MDNDDILQRLRDTDRVNAEPGATVRTLWAEAADEIELLREAIRDLSDLRVIEGNVVENAYSGEAIASADMAAAVRRALAVPDEYLDD